MCRWRGISFSGLLVASLITVDAKDSFSAGNVEAGLSGGTIGSTTYQSNTEFGWTGGAGVEVAFTPNWTAKVEYLYVDLSKMTCNSGASCGFDTPFTVPANNSVKFTTSLVRLGVNFKF